MAILAQVFIGEGEITAIRTRVITLTEYQSFDDRCKWRGHALVLSSPFALALSTNSFALVVLFRRFASNVSREVSPPPLTSTACLEQRRLVFGKPHANLFEFAYRSVNGRLSPFSLAAKTNNEATYLIACLRGKNANKPAEKHAPGLF